MWKFNLWNWSNSHWLRAPDGEGAGGGGDGGGSGGGGGAGPEGPGAGGSGDGGGGGPTGDGEAARGPSILDQGGTGETGSTGSTGEQKPPAAPAKAPDWVPANLRNADGSINAEAAAKVATDLRKKLGARAGEVPEKAEAYKADLTSQVLKDAGFTELSKDDPVLPVFQASAHRHGLTQEQFVGIANDIMEFAHTSGDLEGGIDAAAIVKAETAKLGEHGPKIIQTLNTWGETLKVQGVLSETELQEYRFMAGTALGAKVMMKLRELSGEQAIPMDGAAADGSMTAQEAHDLMGKRDAKGMLLYGNDAAHTKLVDDAFAKVFGTQPAGTSAAGFGVR